MVAVLSAENLLTIYKWLTCVMSALEIDATYSDIYMYARLTLALVSTLWCYTVIDWKLR